MRACISSDSAHLSAYTGRADLRHLRDLHDSEPIRNNWRYLEWEYWWEMQQNDKESANCYWCMCQFLDSGLGELKSPCVMEKMSLCLYTYKSRDISLRLGGNLISVGLVKFRVIAFSKSIRFSPGSTWRLNLILIGSSQASLQNLNWKSPNWIRESQSESSFERMYTWIWIF